LRIGPPIARGIVTIRHKNHSQSPGEPAKIVAPSMTRDPFSVCPVSARVPPRLAGSTSRDAGFTLTELLVVVVIIAVLAGLLLPVFNVVQGNSRRIKCASNLRQIGAAILSYAVDHQLNLPGTSASADGIPWDQNIAPYFGYTNSGYKTPANILTCPNDPRRQQLADGSYPRAYTVSGIKPTVSLGLFGSDTVSTSRSLTNISGTAKKIMAFECFSTNAGASVPNEQFRGRYDWTNGFQALASIPRLANHTYYHGATMNFVFADGHVEALDPTTVYTLW
jgi:prepilin-type N-terminal cleavage/methylation domain-containing protein/prepilin-type processing-associated H-X9-DG protein